MQACVNVLFEVFAQSAWDMGQDAAEEQLGLTDVSARNTKYYSKNKK